MTNPEMTPVLMGELEVFYDECYYQMWCVRKAGCRDFNRTLHFATKEQAEHAKSVIQKWVAKALAATEFVPIAEAPDEWKTHDEVLLANISDDPEEFTITATGRWRDGINKYIDITGNEVSDRGYYTHVAPMPTVRNLRTVDDTKGGE